MINRKVILFDNSSKEDILRIFGKHVSPADCKIMDENDAEVLTPSADTIVLSEFAGFKRGSLIFIKSTLDSLLSLVPKK